jgi:ATP-dependent DNA helicase RecG
MTDPKQFERNVSKNEQPFDKEVYPEAEWGDLRIDAIAKFLALDRVQRQRDYQPGLNPKQQFEKFHFVRGGAKPTNGANLCFGESPNKEVDGCQTKCFYWRDNSRNTGAYDPEMLNGNLISQMDEALLFIKRYLRLERNIGEEGRSDEYDLPIVAIQEAIANALVHREYRNELESVQIDLFDDRIEIASPGRPPKNKTVEALVSNGRSSPRNPLIARIFFLYGYVEQAGTGISRMKAAMAKRGLREPEFKIDDDTFRVILRRSLPAALVTDDRQLHGIPSPPADFTGREYELKELLASIKTGGVTISGLQGMGGVGKTALALKLVEQLKPRYPDAQFFLDLKGSSAQPLTVADAMAHVVRAYHPAA